MNTTSVVSILKFCYDLIYGFYHEEVSSQTLGFEMFRVRIVVTH